MLYLRRVGAEIYGVPLDRLVHSEKLLIYDKWGNKRGIFDWKDPNHMIQLRKQVRELLNETDAPEDPQPVVPPSTAA